MEIDITKTNNNIINNNIFVQHKKKKIMGASEAIDTQINYLAKLILSLENRQAAESIKYILEAKKIDNNDGILILI